MQRQSPVYVLNTNTKREHGRQAQLGNIAAARAVSDVIRTCLGPRAMLKMVLDAMGTIVLTNDGNAILRELEVSHPAAKSIIELSKNQDENVGDGTTSVAILGGEILAMAEPWIEKQIHPLKIIEGFTRALDDSMEFMKELTKTVDTNNLPEMRSIIASCIGTKFMSRWSDLFCDIALTAVKTVHIDDGIVKEIDIKRYVRVEKIPGGDITDSHVLKGVMINKDVSHAKMRRRIENPRIVLLDCPLEYKKAESQLALELTSESDWSAVIRQEEEYIQNICNDIIKFKPDIVLTEKGLSDLAQHFFVKNGITAFRRLRKTDNNRLARVCGATICHRTDELQEHDIGTKATLFEVRKIGDEYFTVIEGTEEATACTIVLRGANKDVLQEISRNLDDAMNVARNIIQDPQLVPGGGAVEMALSQRLLKNAGSLEGVQQWAYRGVATALEVIPRTLAQNCGARVLRVLTDLRAKHASDPEGNKNWGINGYDGTLVDMAEYGVWEPMVAKTQTIKMAIESATMLLRVDDIVSGIGQRGDAQMGGQPHPEDFES